MRAFLVASLAVTLVTPLDAQKFVNGFFMGTESGTPIELIAWAEAVPSRPLRMADSSLEDAPILPRTYRALLNLGSFQMVGVLATTQKVFSETIERIEHRTLPFSATRLGIATFEIGVPDLEDWDQIQRLRRSLKASPDNPMIFFFVVANGAVVRHYPFFLERD